MTAPLIRAQGPVLASSLALLLVGCVGSTTGYLGAASAPPPVYASAPPPPNRNPDELIGRWGYAAYNRDTDRARTQAAARVGCNRPYAITPGPNGGVLMHLADEPELQELRLKLGSDGKTYLGLDGPAPDLRDREVVSLDGQVMVMRWVDPEVASRYGTSVHVRCGGPSVAASKRKAG
jgi:hypothetical protein